MYCQYVAGKYSSAVVIFDGYKQSSTKDMTHQRRTGGKPATSVTFSDDMKLTMKKDQFLSNSSNKQSFINMLSRYLQEVGCQTHHSQADADLLIVQTAVESARRANTVLVGDDTDLLFLLCYTQKGALKNYFFSLSQGQFNKTTCLEHESSEGGAGSRRVQQHFLHPCSPWMWYYFSPSRDWKGDLSEEILPWEPSLSQSS